MANAKMIFEAAMMPSFYKTTASSAPATAIPARQPRSARPLLTAQQIEDVVAYLVTLKECTCTGVTFIKEMRWNSHDAKHWRSGPALPLVIAAMPRDGLARR